MPVYPRIVPFDFVPETSENLWTDARHASEMPYKGYAFIHVETERGTYYEICFYDPVRLRQDTETTVKHGAPCYAEYGALVLLPDVTVEAVEKSVQFLWEKGYFASWKPDDRFTPPTP